MSDDPRNLEEAEKRRIIQVLRSRSVNTVQELRRMERTLAAIGTPDVTEPMTTAWAHYVNSHMLLTQLRSLSRNYPFSSECLDEAKRRVLTDPTSNRSWNLCWLILVKIQVDSLIPHFAAAQAASPAMWADQTPTAYDVQRLTTAFMLEWQFAVDQILRHWERPPVHEG